MSANRLYFAQHGLAVDKIDDPERPLSNQGIAQTTAIADRLLHANIPIAQIFHSGKLRASQTAEIISTTLKIESVLVADQLAPNDDIASIIQNLNTDNALYIGHLPHLEKLVSYLICGDETRNIIKFQNSAIICLEKYNNAYRICWYTTADF